MPTSIDVSGLPEPVVRDIQQLVDTLRHKLAKENGNQPALEQSTEAWSARLRAWAASHPKRDIVIDDSRETIYAGRGE